MNVAKSAFDIPENRPGLREYYALSLLFIVNALNFLDRQLPFILGDQIKAELSLSDAELGVLGGLTFGIVYSLLGIPIARWADRRSQVTILSAAAFIWSAMTAAGSIARSFIELALARAGVALGEAGAAPCAHALIASLFGPRHRTGAIALFTLGLPLGTMAGLFAGGWIADHAGWRSAMLIMGLPGMVLAALIITTVRAPAPIAKVEERASFWKTAAHLSRNRTYRHIVLAMIAYGAAYSSFQTFQPPLLHREFALSFGTIGLYLGLLQGVLGGIATLLGGFGGDRLARRDPRWRLWLPAAALFLSAPLFAAAQFAGSPGWCVAALAIPVATLSFIQPPVFAAVQDIAPEGARATTTATLFFCLTIFGVATGGLLTGAISDHLSKTIGPRALVISLSLTGLLFLAAAIFMSAAARALKHSAMQAD